MGTEVDSGASEPLGADDSDLKALEKDFKELQDEAQMLLSERVKLDNDLDKIKKR